MRGQHLTAALAAVLVVLGAVVAAAVPAAAGSESASVATTDGPGAAWSDRVAGTTDEDAWWNDSWEHRRELEITERSGTDLRNYPVVTPPIDIGSADPASIRVVNERTGEPVPFAVNETAEGYRLAFKIDVDANGTTGDFAVYYGNPGAESVAIDWTDARYNFYDGFEDGTFTGTWTVDRGEWVESDGTLKPVDPDGAQIHHNLTRPLDQSRTPIYWETQVTSLSTGGGTDQRRAFLRNESGEGHRVLFVRTFQNGDDGVGVNIGWDSPDSRKLLTADQFAVGDPIREELLLRPDGDIEALAVNEANGERGELTYTYDRTYEYARVVLNDHGGDPGAEWEYVKLRYKVNPEPAVSVGEQRSGGPTEAAHGLGIRTSDVEVEADETVTLRLVFTNATDGVGAHDFVNVSVGDTDVATVTDVTSNVSSGATTRVASDGSEAAVRVAFGGDTPDTGTVTVATVTLRGQSPGNTSLTVTVAGSVSKENGKLYGDVALRNATVEVLEGGPEAFEGFPAAPTDPDGDDRYEDLNGNGRLDVGDVQTLFTHRDSDVVQNNPAAFDFNANGIVDIGDVQALLVEHLRTVR